MEWIEFDKLDPIGRERIDLGFGVVAAAAMNAMRVKGPPDRPIDHMPIQQAQGEPQSEEEMRMILEHAIAAGRAAGTTEA